MKSITDLAEWQALSAHCNAIKNEHMRDWFSQHPKRATQFSLSVHGITLDYSRNRIQETTLAKLIALAKKCELKEKLRAIYEGDIVNQSEQKPALHMHLRANNARLTKTNCPTQNDIQENLSHMQQFAEQLQQQPITDIINIGIGGSHLGPLMTTHALKPFSENSLRFHFISTPDHELINEVLGSINPATSLFIISSKSFTTIETLTNANTIKTWLTNQLGDKAKNHLVAITAHKEKALAFGIAAQHIFPMWDAIGGRYSVWSAIGLPLFLQIGSERFATFLQGAQDIDQHMLQADYAVNLPILLALIGIWNNNFLDATAHAIIPYAYRLQYLIPYLQQLDMESNGKSVNQSGKPVNYKTGPIIFGQEGTNGQHAYHQWLHQSPSWASADFIVIEKPLRQDANVHHQLMKGSALSQAEALMRGTLDTHHTSSSLAEKSRVLNGNRATNIIYLDSLSPYHLGALIALYEHKIAAQGIIWQINSFDQWGVELGKQLLPGILTKLMSEADKDLI